MTKQMNWKWMVLGSLVLAVASSLVACGDDEANVASVEGETEPQDTTGGDDVATAPVDVETEDIEEAPEDIEEEVVEELIPTEPPPGALKTTLLLDGLTSPWALDFLPDGRVLLTERSGDLHLVNLEDNTLSAPLAGVPEVWAEGQGGLLDVLVDPDFENNNTLYLSYSEKGLWDEAGSAVARATLTENGLEDVTKIFEQSPKVVGPNHFGSRMQFDTTGALVIGLGERFEFMDDAQTLDNHMGKVVRVMPDGSIPEDNPFVGVEGALPEIWSIGHRNIQGMAVHPVTGVIYVHEHGPQGGDEVNIPKAGKNYGWPLACYGDHYWGTVIPDDHAGQGFEEPLHYWTPSIAPSGMTFYKGDEFPHWKGNLFVGALAKRHLARLVMDGDTVVEEEQLLLERDDRFRAVEEGPDGALYVLTDDAENGTLLRLTWE